MTISISSISFGSIAERLLVAAVVWPLPMPVAFMRTPSMIQIGALLSDSEFRPRIRICGGAPVLLPGTTDMLEILPTNSSDIVVIDVCSTRALTSPSVAMVLPSSTFRCWPVAVVTTSCSLTTAISSVKSAVVVPPFVTVTVFFAVVYPRCSTCSSRVPARTFLSVYLPSWSVVADAFVPSASTLASASGWLVPAATALPVTVPCDRAAMGVLIAPSAAMMSILE